MSSAKVIQKRRAAITWANTVNNSGQAEGRWRYLLLSEADVDDAAGSWTHMKGFGQVGYPFHCHLPHRSFEALCRAPWPIFGWLGEASGS